MKQNSTKPLKWLTGVIGALGLISVIGLAAQTMGFFWGFPISQKAVWIDDMEYLQAGIAIFRLLGGTTLFISLIVFMFNSIKALNNGILFPRKNIFWLFCAAATSFIFLFCETNVLLVLGEQQICLDFEEILVPAIISTFALIYRVAVQVSEENSLTI